VNSFIYGKIYFPVKSNALKNLGAFVGAVWTHPNSSGLQSLVWRYHWSNSQNSDYRKILLTYNEEDCKALYLLTKELLHIAETADSKWNVDFADKPKKHTFNEIGSHKKPKILSYFRLTQTPGKIIQVPPRRKCTSCKGKIKITEKTGEITITDLVFTKNGCRKTITKYIGKKVYCKKCKEFKNPKMIRDFKGKIFGHSFMAWAVYQRVILRLPYELITQVMEEMFSVRTASSTVVNFIRILSRYYSHNMA
jgi:hypothetical protein